MISLLFALALAAADGAPPYSLLENAGAGLLPGRYLTAEPREHDIRGLYPIEALEAGVSGKAVLDCFVAPAGLVHSCTVQSETPQGQGFADASLAAAYHYRFSRDVASDAWETPVRLAFVWDAKAVGAFLPPPPPLPLPLPPLPVPATPRPPAVVIPAPSGPPPRADIITKPDWARVPAPEDFARYYPEAARAAGTEGRVFVGCKVKPNGTLEACGVISESPAGAGFGDASLLVARLFKLKLRQTDGAPVNEGSTIRVPILWKLPAPPNQDGSPSACANK